MPFLYIILAYSQYSSQNKKIPVLKISRIFILLELIITYLYVDKNLHSQYIKWVYYIIH